MRRHFFAYMSRMKHIKRWALMRNTWQEDIAQHSLQVSMIAHALALLRNRRFGGGADPERAALLALYHEAPEVITRAADKIAAYIKCVEDLRAGNDEFARAGESILAQIEALDLPEARAFLSEFLPSFRLTMDELN